MRVAIDATSLIGPRTGVGTFTHELLTRLVDVADVDVVTYAASWRGRGHLADLVPRAATVVQRPMAASALRALWRRWDHPRIERWTGSVDVVHGPNFVVPPSAAGRVVSVHDLTFLHHPEMSTRHTLEYPELLGRAIAGGAWVHVDADAIGAEVIAALDVDPSRVVTIPLAPSEVPAADPAAGRALAGSDRYVLALGTVEPRKDLPGLVAAFDRTAAAVPDVHLVLAGPDGWGDDPLGAAIARARHGDRVVRTGWVDDHQRASLLRGASVLAYPSRYEGFGLPPLEAMSVGTPVVTTDAGALAETCAGGALVVPVGDTEALGGALLAVLTDDAEAGRLRTAGPAWAARYDWDRTTAAMIDLYRRAAGGPTGR